MKIQILPNILEQITHINSSLPKLQLQPKYNVSMKGRAEDSYWYLAMVKYDDNFEDDIEEEKNREEIAEKREKREKREFYVECQCFMFI